MLAPRKRGPMLTGRSSFVYSVNCHRNPYTIEKEHQEIADWYAQQRGMKINFKTKANDIMKAFKSLLDDWDL